MTSSHWTGTAGIASHTKRIALQLLHWWRAPDAAERYLAAASDHADLERRVQALERTDCGPRFVTYNH
jgi:hypothetical protein